MIRGLELKIGALGLGKRFRAIEQEAVGGFAGFIVQSLGL